MQNLKFKIFIIAIFCLYLLIASPFAFAHKVNIFAYVEGDTVYTESYFPDGKKVRGGTIEVYDSQGKKLLEGTTDDNGQFNFKPTKKDGLEIVINASMGHRNSYILSADELLALEREEIKSTPNSDRKIEQVDVGQIKRIVDESIDRRLRPIVKKLTKLEEKKISSTEVIGGIGYIFGITGIIFYFLSKRKKD